MRSPRHPKLLLLRITGDSDASEKVSDDISKALNLPHISVNKILHEKANDQYYLHSEVIQDCFDQILDVPVSLVVELLETEIRQRIGEGKQWMLVSGFPKDAEHIAEFDRKVCAILFFLNYTKDHCSCRLIGSNLELCDFLAICDGSS